MVVVVGADAGRILHHCDPHLAQMLCGSDAAEHQDLRRLDRSGAEDHLAPRAEHPPVGQLDSGRAAPFDQHPRDMRAGLQVDVAARHRRAQHRARGGLAPAVADQPLAAAVTFRVRAVKVGAGGELQLAQRVHEGVVEPVRVRHDLHVHRARCPVEHALGIVLVVLGAGEIGQHFGVGPAGRAQVRPVVVIGRMAAEIDHPVDAARAADHSPARHRDRPPGHARLRHRGKAPVGRLPPDRGGDEGGHMDERMGVVPAGLDHAGGAVGSLPQPRRQRRARRARAHHDVIEFRCDHEALPSATVRRERGVGKDSLSYKCSFELSWRLLAQIVVSFAPAQARVTYQAPDSMTCHPARETE